MLMVNKDYHYFISAGGLNEINSCSEWAEQVDSHVPSHAYIYSAGDICIISDTFYCSEIISVAEMFSIQHGITV